MKKLFKKTLFALNAFFQAWKKGEVAPEKTPEYALAVKDLALMMNDTDLNMALMEASMQAKLQQDKQIDDYFKEVMSRHISKEMLDLYWQDQSKIPTARSSVEIVTDFSRGLSGRHVKFYFRDQLIGDARFMTKFKDGAMTLFVEKIIK